MANFKPAKMPKVQAEPLSQILQQYVRQNALAGGLRYQVVSAAWDKVSGAARFTNSKYLKNNILYITVSSSVVRSQLLCQLDLILSRINEILRADSIVGEGSGECEPIQKIVLR